MTAELLEGLGLPAKDRRRSVYYAGPCLHPPPKFETEDYARELAIKRLDALMCSTANVEDILAQLLADICCLREWRNPANPVQARSFRCWFYRQNKKLLKPFLETAKVITILLERVPAGGLSQVSPASAKRRLRTIFGRCNMQGAVVSGGIEASWHQDEQVWVIHAHLLVIGASKIQRNALRSHFKKQGKRNVKAQPLDPKDTARQLSYLLKFNTFHRPGSQFGNHRARAFSLPAHLKIELMQWWSAHDFADFTSLFGLRRIGKRLVMAGATLPTSPTENQRRRR